MSKHSENEWPGQGGSAASVYGYAATLVHHEQTVRERVVRPGKGMLRGKGVRYEYRDALCSYIYITTIDWPRLRRCLGKDDLPAVPRVGHRGDQVHGTSPEYRGVVA